MNEYQNATDLFGRYRLIKKEGKPMDERRQLLQEISDKTGYPIGYLLHRLAGMQKVEDLRFILSAMANVPKAKDSRHAFNTVLYQPQK